MIEKSSVTGFDVSCDRCSFQETFDTEYWDHLMTEMKAYGWKNVKEDGEWVHYCSLECLGSHN